MRVSIGLICINQYVRKFEEVETQALGGPRAITMWGRSARGYTSFKGLPVSAAAQSDDTCSAKITYDAPFEPIHTLN